MREEGQDRELALDLSWGWKNQNDSSVFSLESSRVGWTHGKWPWLTASADNMARVLDSGVRGEGCMVWGLGKRISRFPLTHLDHPFLVSGPLHLLLSVCYLEAKFALRVCTAALSQLAGVIQTPPAKAFLALSSPHLLFPHSPTPLSWL